MVIAVFTKCALGALAPGEVHIRDPFIVPHEETGIYYLFGTTGHLHEGNGFDYFTSKDLREWEGPFPAFRPPEGFWADRDFWAPEVHRYRGGWYMFATFKAEGRRRGTQILAAEDVAGPYRPHSDGPVTPEGWECLDGTLHVDIHDDPWMVFCHEWVQAGHGEIQAIRLTDDLRAATGPPQLLFRASDAPWAHGLKEKDRDVVTDGPFIERRDDGSLVMFWSSFVKNDAGGVVYAQGVSRSESGEVTGPWLHEPDPIYRQDGGHGMPFTGFDGRRYFTLHSPNTPFGEERVRIFALKEKGATFSLAPLDPDQSDAKSEETP